MDEDIYRRIMEHQKYSYDKLYYDTDRISYDIERIKEEVEREIKRRNIYNRPIIQTDEEKLDSIDIAVIEKYLRKKKLDNIQKK